MADLSSFLLACLALVASPGPATLMVAATSANYGLRRTAPFILGLLTSMVLIMGLIGSGVAGLVVSIPGTAAVASVLAGAYILYLAYRIATAPPWGSLRESRDQRNAPSYWSGVLLNFVNPKAYAAVAALFSGFALIPEAPSYDALSKGLLTLGVILLGHTAWAIIGATILRFVRQPCTSRIINVGFAAALVVSVALAALV